ncbi:nucleotidyltransferase family protein [Polaribacter sp. R77954]|uniref:nucleotidyltransferase family protein n=1 Tax=Polaribacter sp. R77954 TaxID=3093870 RepID=UPI0037CAE873
MTYKETLFFIGQSLTINHEEKNKIAIEAQLKSNSVDWDAVVKVSTGHFVFPALYCNLKRANFLQYLPEDLVAYMKHITDLNRERNQKIIAQAKEINRVLLTNNITPVFLKGTGNLLECLYEDIAERMVGDIDFIVSKKEYPKAIEVLLTFGYETVHKQDYFYPEFKHYPRIHKKDGKSDTAVEIHKELITEKYAKEFHFDIIKNNTQYKNGFCVLSDGDQLNLTIIAKQINDFGKDYKTISLRNAYDVFLLAQNTSAKDAISIFNKLHAPLNNFLAICYEVFGKIESLEYAISQKTKSYVDTFYKQLEYSSRKKEMHYKKIYQKVLFKKRMEYMFFTIYKKEFRQWILNRFKDKKWKKHQLKKLGFKK